MPPDTGESPWAPNADVIAMNIWPSRGQARAAAGIEGAHRRQVGQRGQAHAAASVIATANQSLIPATPPNHAMLLSVRQYQENWTP